MGRLKGTHIYITKGKDFGEGGPLGVGIRKDIFDNIRSGTDKITFSERLVSPKDILEHESMHHWMATGKIKDEEGRERSLTGDDIIEYLPTLAEHTNLRKEKVHQKVINKKFRNLFGDVQ